jgi:hypothetical protein
LIAAHEARRLSWRDSMRRLGELDRVVAHPAGDGI